MKSKFSLVRVRASRRFFVPTVLASAVVFALMGVKSAQAASMWWDGGTENWSTLAAWSTIASAATPDPTAVPGSADDVTFNRTASNTTANIVSFAGGGRAVRSMTFATTGTSVFRANASGTTTARTLSLGAGGLTINSGAGAVTIGETPATYGAINVALTANQTWTNNSSNTFTLAGIVSGAFNFTKTGTGIIRLNGVNTMSGTLTVSGGTLQIGSYTGLSTVTSLTVSGGSSNLQLVQVGTGTTSNTINKSLSLHGTLSTAGGSSTNLLNQIWDGNITLAGASTITNNGNSSFDINGQLNLGSNALTFQTDGAGSRIDGNIIGSGGSLTKTSSQDLLLTAANSYTGATTISAGSISLGNATPFGTTPGVDGTSGISMAAATTLSANAAAGSSTTLVAPITLSGAGNTNLRIGAGGAGITTTLNLNGAIGGSTGNLVFTTTGTTFGNGPSVFVLGTAHTYTGNTLLTTGNGADNPVFVRNGVTNALPSTTILSFGQVTGGGTGRAFQYDLNGFNQTLAGLDNGGVVPSLRNMTVTSTNAATLTINGSTNTTFGGRTTTTSTTRAQITGALALTKSGTGTFTLGGTLSGGAAAIGNTFTGDTKVLGGILVLGESLSIQNSNFDTSASVVGDAANGLRAGIGGVGVTSLTLGGLSGNKNFADVFTTTTGGYDGLAGLTINSGTGLTNSYAGNIGNGAGALALTKIGAGTQVLTGTNTHSGITSINAGTLEVSGGTALPDTGAVSIANTLGATLKLSANETIGALAGGGVIGGTVDLQANILSVGDDSNTTFDGVIEGSGGSLTKQGAGAFTLTNSQSYTGQTTINAGKLIVNGSISSSTLQLNAGTLTGNGVVGSVTVADSANAVISNNNGAPGLALTTGALSFSGTATINTFSSTPAAAIVASGIATNAAGTVTIHPTGTWTSGATHELISYGGGSIGGAGFGKFALGTVGGLTARQSAGSLANTGTAITFTVIGDTPAWTGLGAATWNTAVTNDDTGPNDWVRKTAKTGTNFWSTDGVEFNDTYDLGAGAVPVTNTTVTISGGVSPSVTIFNNSAVDYTLASSDATGINSGSLIKNGAGTVTINNINAYDGGTTLNAGAVQIGDAGALGNSGAITFAGGTLKYGAGITADLSARFNQSASQLFKVNTNSNDVTFASALVSSGGSLTKEGLGTLTLTNANTYSGATTINGGVLQLGNGGTTGALLATTGITSSGTVSLVINRSNTFTQLTDLNDQVITGAGLSVRKSGAGTATLSGDNSYGGATVINGGTLAITHTNALGNTDGATTVEGGNGQTGNTLSLSSATSDLTIAEDMNLFGNVSGRAQINNTSAQNHTITGAVDVSSDTNLVQITSASTGSITISGDITGTMLNGSALYLRGASTSALNRVVGNLNLSGGNLGKTDAGTWLVGAAGKTYNWVDTLLALGTVKMGAAGVLPATGALSMGNSTGSSTPILDLNGFSQTTVGISYNGAGTATGTKTITNSDLSNPAVLTINHAADLTTGSAAGANNILFTGNLGLTKQGTGKLTLRGTNTYTGNTTIAAGTMEMASNLIANSPNISIGDGATLQSTAGLTLSANQSITGSGTTGFVTTTNTGLITTSGTTISSSGTLTISRLDVRGASNVISGGNIQSGSTASLMRGLLVANGVSSSLTISGGTFTSNGGATNYDIIANTGGAGAPNGVLTVNGGSYVNTANSGKLMLGNGGALAGNPTFTITAGSATIHTLEYNLGTFSGNTGTVNLDGGTLTVSSILSTAGTNRIFNFNGGQFIAGGSSFTVGSSLTLNVKDGGAKIDTNGNSFTISDALVNAGTGGLIKSGLGTLTLAGVNTYIGGTSVAAGAVRFSSAAAGSTNVIVADGAEAGALVEVNDAQWINSGSMTLENNATLLVDFYGNTVPSTTVPPVSVTNFINGSAPGVKLSGAAVASMIVGQTYPLITWSGSGPVDASAFVLRTHRLAGTFSVASNTLFLTVTNNATGSPIAWNTGNGAWDVLTSNWVDPNLAPTTYVNTLDSVLFGDAAGVTGNPLVSLATTVSPMGVTVNTSGRNYTISGGGSISGSGSLTLSSTNTGVLTLSTGGNSYTGGTFVNGGTLALGDASNTLPDSGVVTVDGAFSVLSLAANSDVVGAVTLRNGASITGSGTLTGTSYAVENGSISATLGGSGGLTKTTVDTVTLSGANSYTGATTINAGVLVVGHTNALSSSSLVNLSSAAGSGTLRLATDASVVGFPFSGSSSFPATIVADRATPGEGITHALGAANLANNTWTVAAGDNVTSGNAAVSMASLNLTAGNTGTCLLSPTTASVLIAGPVNIGTNNQAKTLGLGGLNLGNVISGDISNGLNTLSVTKTGMSTWTLSGLNSYSGVTTIDQGRLVFDINDQFLSGGLTFGAAASSVNVGSLDLSTVNATFGGALTVQTNSNSPNTIVVGSGKTLTLNSGLIMSNNTDAGQTRLTMSGGGALVVNGASMTVGSNTTGTNSSSESHLDLSAMGSFSATLTGNLIIQAQGDNSDTDPSSLTLSNMANSITAASVRVGNSSTGSTNRLWLGSGSNSIQTDLINLGAGTRDSGVIDFAGTGGSVTMRNIAGTGRVANVNLGPQTAQTTGYATNSVVDFTGNTADVAIGTYATSLGAKTAANTNDLRFDAGTLDIRSINMAFAKGTGASTNRITIGGGTVKLGGSEAFADTGTGTITLATAGNGQLIINGGSVSSTAALLKGVGGTGTASVALNDGSLDLNGNNIGTLTDTVAFTAQSGTLANVGQINGGGSWTKSGTGTLVLAGINQYTGAATVNGGTISVTGSLNSSSSMALAGSTLSYSGSSAQSLSGLVVNAGYSTVTNTNTGSTNVINVGAITRNAGGYVNFANSTASNNVIQTTTPNTNGILGTWAFVGSDYAMNDGSGNIVAYSGYTDVTRLTPGVIVDDMTSNVRIVEGSGSAGLITLGATTTSVNTLLQSASGGSSDATVNLASGTLRADAITLADLAGALHIGATPNSGTLTPVSAAGELILNNANTVHPLVINAAIADHLAPTSLVKFGPGTLRLGGLSTYTGTTSIREGILQAAGNLPTTSAVTLLGASSLDLFGASQTISSLANWAGNTLTNSSTGNHASTATAPGSPALTDALVLSGAFTANSLPLLVTDGATRKTQVVLNNSNGNATFMLTNNANTFSGGLVLAHNASNGTRLLLSSTNLGVVGTGPIIVGQSNTDRAGVYFIAAVNFPNDIVFNTARGTDRVGLRADAEVTLGGKITANLAPATFSSNSATAGSVTITGQVTGASGLVLDITSLSAAATNFGVTLNNSGTPNNYAGDTVINLGALSGKSAALNLGAAEQIPHGVGTGNVVINSNGTGNGTLNLGGFSETINGLSGNGILEAGGGTPTLTIGENNATASFSGVIQNSSGDLTLVKTGTGTQTLSGANTYTGTTTVSAGTLALVGGSQASAVTVNAGASLGFTLGSPTTSVSTFDLSAGTIKISGSPTLPSYDLITSSAGITGTPQLDSPVPGYELKVEGNSLKLVQAGYASWAALNGAGANLNDDHDADGVPNGVEYFVGGTSGNTTGFTALPGVVNNAGTLTVTWVMGAGYAGVYGTDFTVETSETLEGAWITQSSPGTVTITGSNVTYTFPAPLGTKKFARLKVTGP
ncbi:MAG: beta strand repeat-containing protein [Akkermansiaceae bacterium]